MAVYSQEIESYSDAMAVYSQEIESYSREIDIYITACRNN
jgi:hypothetical protein